jgi:DNA-binding ferritin-like protein
MRTERKEAIIDTVKEHYDRDLRKSLVRALRDAEKTEDPEALKRTYTLMNRIFSYVLKELEWTIASSSEEWDDTPLHILESCFPGIEKSKWYSMQAFVPKARKIEVRLNDTNDENE